MYIANRKPPSSKYPGFKLHPGSGVYISKYYLNSNNKSSSGLQIKYNTVDNYNYTNGKTINDAITGLSNNYEVMSIEVYSALQLLFLIEQGTDKWNNSNSTDSYITQYTTGCTNQSAVQNGFLSCFKANNILYYYGIEGLFTSPFSTCLAHSYFYIDKKSTNHSFKQAITNTIPASTSELQGYTILE